MIQGISIILLSKTQSGTDGFNRPIYTNEEITVDNVLVAPASSDDITTMMDLTGKKIAYTLALPKGDNNMWEDQYVILPEPFAGTYHVVSYPTAGIEEMIPLSWNKKVMVEKYG